MSTNAMIYAKQADNSVKGVYLHWDGYPGWAGRILLNHYTEDDKIQRLIALGGLSSIGSNPEASELIARFGFDAACYPVSGEMDKYIPATWKQLSDAERERLMRENAKCENTVAYARDRKEPLEFETYSTVEAFKQTSAECAYEYYWDGATWYMRQNKVFRKLSQATCDKLNG